jgi:neurofibromin 1
LRFFCPAIVAPEVEGLINTVPSKDMRRGLTLIAKIIQNLANNVLFGAKEPYMFPLNDFLTDEIYRVTTFLREISVCSIVLGLGLGQLAQYLVSDMDRSRPRERKLPVRGSPSTLAPALPYTGSCMTTGIMCASVWSRRKGGITYALLPSRQEAVHLCWSP